MMPYVQRVARRYRGLGASVGQQATAAGASVGSGVVGALMAAGTITGPVGLAIDAGIALATVAINAIMNSGCGQTCIVSTQFANQAEAALQQNIAAYFALPTPRSTVDQAAALANFDKFWAWLQQQCATVSGSAGQRCITDRQAGACVWKQTAAALPQWGTPPAGACWNWFNGYRDPIANDTNVYTPSAASSVDSSVSSAVSSLTSGTVAGIPTWMLFAGAAVGIFVIAEAL